MANLVLGAAGAAVGFFVGGPQGAYYGWAIGSTLGSVLDPQKTQGPRLNDLRVNGTEYGQTIPWVAGSPRVSGQIIWASEKRETANTESAKGGPEVTTFSYDCDLLVILTENEIADVSRIWVNSELVYGNGTTKSGVWSGINIYTGTDDQMPDPIYEAAVGAGNATAYRGRGYVVIQGLQLGQGGQIPNLTFEIGTANRIYTGLVYVFTESGTNPSWVDSSINEYPVLSYVSNTGQTFASADGEVKMGGTLRYVVLNNPFAVANHNSDFVVEFDMKIIGGDYSDLGLAYASAFVFAGTDGNPTLGFKVYPYGSRFLVVGTGAESLVLTQASLSFDISTMLDVYVPVTLIRRGSVFQLWIDSTLVYEKDYDGTIYWDSVNNQFFSTYEIKLFDRSHILGDESTQNGLYLKDFRFATVDIYSGAPGPFAKEDPLNNYYLEYVYGAQTSIAINNACSYLLDRAGYSQDDYDVLSLVPETKPLRGLAVGQVSATRATLEQLQSAWFFEASKSDKIYIRPRAETSVVTIPYSDLGASADPSSEDDAFSLTLSNDLEIPAQIALSYPNMEQDYQVATEHSDRIFSSQESTQTVQLGIGMTSAEAKGVADAMIFDMAAAQTKTTLRVPLKYAYVEPGDIVEAVNFDGRTYRLRVQTKRDTLTMIELECVIDDVGALQSASITDDGYLSIADPVTVEQTEFEALDIPILRDADNSAGYYMAVAPIITNPGNNEWKGAQAVRSWNGTDYSELFTTSTACVMGECSNTLGDWTGGNVYDETNTITVVTTGGELSCQTREAMQLDGTLNVAAVGSQANGWEIIRFRNATLTGTNTYVLSGLHRGFRGTEWAIGSHVASEQFILLNTGIRRVEAQTSQIGLERFLKAATFGLRLSDVTDESFTDTGIALKPFSPANPVALADGSDIVVTWQRRTRVSYVYGGATPSVPLGEASESYRVRIYDGVTLVRTETVTSPTYTYVAADIASDGFVSTDTITFEICQVSEIIGAGYTATCEGIAP